MEYCTDGFTEEDSAFTVSFLYWLKLKQHDWVCKQKRLAAIENEIGEGVTIKDFPVRLKMPNLIIVGSKAYQYNESEEFMLQLEEAIINEGRNY